MLLHCIVGEVDEIIVDVETVLLAGHAQVAFSKEVKGHVFLQ